MTGCISKMPGAGQHLFKNAKRPFAKTEEITGFGRGALRELLMVVYPHPTPTFPLSPHCHMPSAAERFLLASRASGKSLGSAACVLSPLSASVCLHTPWRTPAGAARRLRERQPTQRICATLRTVRGLPTLLSVTPMSHPLSGTQHVLGGAEHPFKAPHYQL